jgi:polyhydroxyalkanoate synthase
MGEMQGSIYDKLNEEFSNGQLRFINALELPEKMRNVQVGLTPRERIWYKNKASLYHYFLPDGGGALLEPGQPKPRIPLLIVYALINKPYVLDLRPNSSFIDYMLQRGFEVYLLDWGTPSDEDGRIRLDDYVLDYIPRAIRKMRQHAGVNEFTLLGYCMGGTLSLLYTAARKDDQPENLILLASPVDFGQPNTFSLWLKEQYFNVDALVNTLGLVPGEMVDFGSKMLKPFQNYVQSYLDLHGKLWDDKFVESWVAMNKWVNDGIPMSGETFRQWVNDFYRHNKLLKGEMVLGSRQISLKDITCNLLSVIAERDHIVPPEMTRPLMNAVGSKDKYEHSIPAGHVGMVAGRGAVKQLWPMIGDWMEKRSQ